uniref:Secreted protein n=1 Tax=Pararge aegeria TaxID=116150 RepID=S4P2B8_9NEOP
MYAFQKILSSQRSWLSMFFLCSLKLGLGERATPHDTQTALYLKCIFKMTIQLITTFCYPRSRSPLQTNMVIFVTVSHIHLKQFIPKIIPSILFS